MLCLYFIIGKEKLLLPFSFIFNLLDTYQACPKRHTEGCEMFTVLFSFPCYTFQKDHDLSES